MPASFTCLYYHLIFSTKERRPFITHDIQQRMYEYLGGIITHEGGRLRACGGAEDHIHLLVSFPPTRAVSDLFRVIKANSSKWIHDTFSNHRHFRWQDG